MAKRFPKDARDNKPLVSVTLTRESVYLTRYDDRGKPAITYPVRASDVSEAFNDFGASTGLLPTNTLFWQTVAGQACIGVYIPPARYTLQLADARKSKLAVSLPGFVFVGRAARYALYAVAGRPTQPSDALFAAPLPNVHPDGAICFGNVTVPTCTPATLMQAFALFFGSQFNNHLTAGKLKNNTVELMAYLRSLQGRRVPIRDLVTVGRLDELLADDRCNDQENAPDIDDEGDQGDDDDLA